MHSTISSWMDLSVSHRMSSMLEAQFMLPQESTVQFKVRITNGQEFHLRAFLVYDSPVKMDMNNMSHEDQGKYQHLCGSADGTMYAWKAVARAHCRRPNPCLVRIKPCKTTWSASCMQHKPLIVCSPTAGRKGHRASGSRKEDCTIICR